MKKTAYILLLKLILILTANSLYSQFKLDDLPYSYSALEPYIDAKTMEIHHSKHHRAYVNNFNNALETSEFKNKDLIDIMLNISKTNNAIRNNGGGHYNHKLFWQILSPDSKDKPSGELLNAINKHFDSLESMIDKINKEALTRFGSGWVWLIVSPDKELKITSTANQDNPLMDVEEHRGIPIIGIDVWEHAYYLKYQNRRGEYMNNIWNVINWEAIEKNYEKAINSDVLERIR